MEARKGFSRQRAKAKTDADRDEIQVFESDFDDLLTSYGDRILSVDRAVADLWGTMLGEREANVMDTAVAATVISYGLVVATRNGRHFRDRGVRLVNPFQADPFIAGS